MDKKKQKQEPKKKGLLGNWIVRNLFWGVVFVAGIFLVINITLRVVTQHDINVTVPDLVGSNLNQARESVAKDGLELIVTDSVSVNRFKRGAVYAQNPKAGEKVKRGRKIYLTMNASHEKQVAMPDLVGYSLRQAKVELTARKLKLGKLTYVKDIATNNVLAQMRGNEPIEPGTRIDIGTVINLQLGLDPDDAFTAVPDFAGYKYQRALSALQDNSFNLAGVVFDSTVKTYSDSLAAFVYRQEPAASDDNQVQLGTAVRLYLTLDEAKLPVKEEPAEETAE